MTQQADNVFRGIDRHLLGADHADLRVSKHAHKVFNCILMGDGVAAFQDTNFTLGSGKEEVDGAGFAFASLLFN